MLSNPVVLRTHAGRTRAQSEGIYNYNPFILLPDEASTACAAGGVTTHAHARF